MRAVWQKIVAALAALAAVLAFLLWRKRQKDHADSLADALAVARAERDIARLDGERKQVDARVDAREGELQAIENELAANRRAVVEARTGVQGLDEEGVLAEYRRLGYLK